MYFYKDETGHHYGDFRVIGITNEREPSNGVIKWACECVHCGHRKVINGNVLRFGRTKGRCPICNRRKRRTRK